MRRYKLILIFLYSCIHAFTQSDSICIEKMNHFIEWQNKIYESAVSYKFMTTTPKVIGVKENIYFPIYYPKDAIEKKIEGEVHIQFFIDNEGFVCGERILKTSNDIFNEEAFNIFHSLKLSPAFQDDNAIEVVAVVVIQFQLKRKSHWWNFKKKTIEKNKLIIDNVSRINFFYEY